MHRHERARPATIGSRYEIWFVAHLTFGFAYVGGALFLLPPFVLALPGATPAEVGIVVAMLSLVRLAAPFVGSILDRTHRYRLVQLLGLVALAAGLVVLAATQTIAEAAFGALLLGFGATLVTTTNLVLVAGSGLADDEMAQRMSLLHMSLPVGQLMALLIISGLIAAGADSPTIFLVLAGLVGIGLLITAATDGPAAARAVTHARLLATRGTTDPKAPTHSRGERPDTPTTWAFGLVLAVLFLSWSAFATLETQYANYMDQVFGIDTGVAAAALAVAVLFTIPMYPWAGRLATWVRYKVPIQSSTAARVGVGVALWLVAAPESVPAVLPLALYVVLMLSLPLYEINGTLLSAVTSPGRPGRGQGGYGFALAASFIAGAVVAGWAADAFGYRSLAIIAAAIALVALALGSRLSDARAESGA